MNFRCTTRSANKASPRSFLALTKKKYLKTLSRLLSRYEDLSRSMQRAMVAYPRGFEFPGPAEKKQSEKSLEDGVRG